MRPSGALLFWLFASALALWLQTSAPSDAEEPPNPFPSPTPVSSHGGNGFGFLGFMGGSADGGTIAPLAGSTRAPAAFGSAHAGGFNLDLLGRLSPLFLAGLKFDDLSVHGADNPVVTFAQGLVLYDPRGGNAAFGLGFISAQRSSANVNANGVGVGAEYLPTFKPGPGLYGSAFIYPRLRTGDIGFSLFSADAGVVFVPSGRGGLFLRAGLFTRSGGGASFSPNSISGVNVGVGAAF
ncbi:MAG: hypothetical protein DLM53_12295 [Candidatus Eremiobacter antarcticus]|nr:hypothetical protein [Candidatus Eremiobacteraeota bacterium]MBC5808883.1 hypothetical protein [Candidatus Eremiobacteraeota bacterium]PZR60432.1 MAG: hypothetical protein DLM53_12295 [Candidatus Eremiobacter sp. RRmetagenome_bin22]